MVVGHDASHGGEGGEAVVNKETDENEDARFILDDEPRFGRSARQHTRHKRHVAARHGDQDERDRLHHEAELIPEQNPHEHRRPGQHHEDVHRGRDESDSHV